MTLDVYFSMSNQELRELSDVPAQSSCHEANVAVKTFPLSEKICRCQAQGGLDLFFF